MRIRGWILFFGIILWLVLWLLIMKYHWMSDVDFSARRSLMLPNHYLLLLLFMPSSVALTGLKTKNPLHPMSIAHPVWWWQDYWIHPFCPFIIKMTGPPTPSLFPMHRTLYSVITTQKSMLKRVASLTSAKALTTPSTFFRWQCPIPVWMAPRLYPSRGTGRRSIIRNIYPNVMTHSSCLKDDRTYYALDFDPPASDPASHSPQTITLLVTVAAG
jgi:hypothetical protein